MKFQRINIISGWLVFAVAALTYILTIEPTTSFWDCGEFITSSFKLEVGHPPGAPFFMLIGRFFTLFAFGDLTKVSVMINIMSALASGFTILFLYWTITHIARKIVNIDVENPEISQLIAIIGTGVVGALAYTFSDTFWFSAVEGEVYAMSSFFTAIVFWAILKWENVANENYANRWIILIAYLMGLSIGVHLLNLLAIPAIVLVYYFKKYDFSIKGLIITLGLAVALLIGVMYIIIPGFVWGASRFELIFVNSFGLPFNTGTFVYIIILIALLILGLYFTVTKRKVVLNTIVLGITVILIGYSSFALIMIRSLAKPPMDQNSPKNVFALQGYLNREQYGDRPLFSGEYFNAKVTDYEKTKPTYIQKDGKYVIVDYSVKRVFDNSGTTIFPRMYSDQAGHPEEYANWAGLDNLESTPTFGQNLKFFFKYQINFMYLRYFLWNFVGRQSDVQTYGSVAEGNWISGIGFIDNLRLGDQSKLPDYMKYNEGKNKYYFLPLILGLFGMFFMFRKKKEGNLYFWIVLSVFIMTGLAIIVYLNQTPLQPRERDYAYAGSFYAFAIYIGFGVLGLYEIVKKYLSPKLTSIIVSAICLLSVPVLMASQNWDDHDRSGRYTARDFAYNYLNSCAENAIIFTNGDNDTFPLWYAQEVEGIRTDVRVINLSYLNTDWYIDQMKRKVYESNPVPFSLTYDQYVEGTRDIMYVNENPTLFLNEKYNSNINTLKPIYSDLYNRMMAMLSKSNFPTIETDDYASLSKGYESVSPVVFGSFVSKLSKKENITKYGLDDTLVSHLKTDATALLKTISDEYLPANLFMKFITSDSPDAKVAISGEDENYIPTTKIRIAVDKQKVIASGTVAKEDEDLILPYIDWNFNKTYLTKSELMVVDLIASNNWERPVYFAITVGSDSYLNLQSYFQLEGMAYRVVPIKNKDSKGQNVGRINVNILYENLINKFVWGNIENPNVYLDENNKRMLMNIKNNFARLAGALITNNRTDEAIKVLDKCTALIPNQRVAYNYYNILLAEQYYYAKDTAKANEIMNILADNTEQEMNFYWTLSENKRQTVKDDAEMSLGMVQEIISFFREHKQAELDILWTEKFATIMSANIDVIKQFEQLQENQAALYQWYAGLSSTKQQIISLYVNLVSPEEEEKK